MSIYDRILSRTDVERAVRDHVKLWIPQYIREKARQDGVDPDKVPQPRTVKIVSKFVELRDEQFPLIGIISAGIGGSTPRPSGDGAYTAGWEVGVGAVVSARDADSAAYLSGLYGAALRAMMLQQGDMGIDASTYWTAERYDDLRPGDEQSRASVRMAFVIYVDDVVNGDAGPLNPDDPIPPAGDDWPTAEAPADMIIEREEITGG